VAWVIWFWLLIRCFADIFRPARPRAGAKGPLDDLPDRVAVFGVFAILIVKSAGMAGRDGIEVKAS
jgi:hypothetical protein